MAERAWIIRHGCSLVGIASTAFAIGKSRFHLSSKGKRAIARLLR